MYILRNKQKNAQRDVFRLINTTLKKGLMEKVKKYLLVLDFSLKPKFLESVSCYHEMFGLNYF